MTYPLPPGAGDDSGDDEIAELLLANAIGALDLPGMGDPSTTPDMGVPPMTAPTPPTTPPVPTPPVPTPPPAQASTPPAGVPQNGPDGFPLNTPLTEMNAEQQACYWRDKARKHEDRVKQMADYDQLKATKDSYDALVAASQTDQERAVAEARRQGHAEATTQAGGRLVEAYVHAAAAGRLDQERVNALLGGMDRSKFLDAATGEVDTDRVTAFVHALAPAAAAPVAVVAGAPEQQSAMAAAPAATARP